MFTHTIARKVINAGALIALAGLGLFVVELLSGHPALTGLCVTAAALTIMEVVRDYAVRHPRWEPIPATRPIRPQRALPRAA